MRARGVPAGSSSRTPSRGPALTEVAKRVNVTQQAASKMIAELIRLGVVQATSAKDKRAKRVRLSPRGWDCVQLGRQTRAEVDGQLARRRR
ncbi:MAG: hypothetical protein DMG69_22110 [Acidobacteria bacterium]|nr:MAG: hypothetical protein DMG69_22110 [Acidobacteriota bacterium]